VKAKQISVSQFLEEHVSLEYEALKIIIQVVLLYFFVVLELDF